MHLNISVTFDKKHYEVKMATIKEINHQWIHLDHVIKCD